MKYEIDEVVADTTPVFFKDSDGDLNVSFRRQDGSYGVICFKSNDNIPWERAVPIEFMERNHDVKMLPPGTQITFTV